MTPEEYQSDIKFVKDRYESLNLSFEQAEQIYKYEQVKNSHSEKHHFSEWEEWDYETSVFGKILDLNQFKVYQKNLAQLIDRYTQSLIKLDQDKEKEIAYHQELLTYYENVFLPDLLKDSFIFPSVAFYSEKAKIEFLKSEYKLFLSDRKKEILTQHFRHYRLLKPNELQLELLRHKILCVWPNYFGFKHMADDAVKAVMNYLKVKIRRVPDQTDVLLTRKLNDLKNFNTENLQKYFSDSPWGWQDITRQLTDEEEREERVMTLLLLDQEKYGA